MAKQQGRIGRDGQGRGVFVGAVIGFDDGELVAAIPVLEAGCGGRGGGGGRGGRVKPLFTTDAIQPPNTSEDTSENEQRGGRWAMNVRCHKRGRLRKGMDSIMNR